MRTNFSAGPYTVCFTLAGGSPIGFHIAASPHGSAKPLAECNWWDWSLQETVVIRANGHLFAAAPDLYSALEKIVLDWDGEPEDMSDARAALAKARGETA